MIDPRNMPCARVRLSRLLPKELPPNAQEQYHNYTIQRKSSLTSLNVPKDPAKVVVSSVSPVDFSCELGESDQSHATSLDVPRNTVDGVDAIQYTAFNTQHLPNNDSNGYNASVQSSLSSYSRMPTAYDQVDLEPVTITTNMSTKRRSSVVSLSSSHSSGSSKGREIVASVSLTPVTWKRSRCTTRPYEDCIPKTELELDEISDVTDKSTLPESKDNFPYYMRKNLVSACNFLCDLFIFDVVRSLSFVVLLQLDPANVNLAIYISLGFALQSSIMYYQLVWTPALLNHFSFPLRVWNSRLQLYGVLPLQCMYPELGFYTWAAYTCILLRSAIFVKFVFLGQSTGNGQRVTSKKILKNNYWRRNGGCL